MIKLVDFFSTIGEFATMLFEVCWAVFDQPPKFSLVRDQLYEIGVRSIPVVALTGFATGLVLAVQSFFQLSDKGLAGMTGLMVTKSMLVELGPILTAFMLTGRVGAAIAAELGTMKVSEQVDALASMAVNPLSYLVAPRVIAMGVMAPLLTVFSSAMGILGGYMAAVLMFGMPSTSFFQPIPIYVNWFDVSSGLIKSFFFGLLIVSISCFQGLRTTGGAAGVGQSTTTSVVITYASILFSNFLLTVGLNAFYWYLFK